MNIATQINDVLRNVELTDTGNVVSLTQSFPTTAEDLWNACTDPARLARWFEPVEGELRPQGRYRLTDSGTEGNIEEYDPPHRLALTWEWGETRSRVEAIIEQTTTGSATLTIHHHGDNDDHWAKYGPAAGGTGWDLSLFGLALHLDDPAVDSAQRLAQVMSSSEGQQRMDDYADAWRDLHIAVGADPDVADQAARRAADANREMWAAPS